VHGSLSDSGLGGAGAAAVGSQGSDAAARYRGGAEGGSGGGGAAAAGPNGTLTVLQATYGFNCNASLAGDMTAIAKAYCDGKDECDFQVCNCGGNTCGPSPPAPPCLPDPVYGCAKDFRITWRCTADAPGFNRSALVPADADDFFANITCGPPPPPAPPAPPLVVPVTIPPNNELGGVPFHTLEVIVKVRPRIAPEPATARAGAHAHTPARTLTVSRAARTP
jgi:hypothetical protein